MPDLAMHEHADHSGLFFVLTRLQMIVGAITMPPRYQHILICSKLTIDCLVFLCCGLPGPESNQIQASGAGRKSRGVHVGNQMFVAVKSTTGLVKLNQWLATGVTSVIDRRLPHRTTPLNISPAISKV